MTWLSQLEDEIAQIAVILPDTERHARFYRPARWRHPPEPAPIIEPNGDVALPYGEGATRQQLRALGAASEW